MHSLCKRKIDYSVYFQDYSSDDDNEYITNRRKGKLYFVILFILFHGLRDIMIDIITANL